MRFAQLCVALVCITGLLSACDKSAKQTETSTSSETTTPTANISSPYMDFQVHANRALVISTLNEDHPNLTDEQKNCLMSHDGDANYLSVLEPYFKGILTDDEIKEADDFFASSTGQKFRQIMLNELGDTTQTPPEPPTEEETLQMTQAMSLPFFVKVKADSDKMSEEEALAFLQKTSDKEKSRCHID